MGGWGGGFIGSNFVVYVDLHLFRCFGFYFIVCQAISSLAYELNHSDCHVPADQSLIYQPDHPTVTTDYWL